MTAFTGPGLGIPGLCGGSRRFYHTPRGFPKWAAALSGAGVVLVFGLVEPIDAARAVAGDWNVLLFFLGMTGMAAVAEPRARLTSARPLKAVDSRQ